MASEPQMIEFARHRSKTEFDVAEAFAKGQLRKTHAQKLIVARKAAGFVITVVTRDAFLKLVNRPVFHDLREDQFAVVHPPLSAPAPAASSRLTLEKGSSRKRSQCQSSLTVTVG